jgi:hypothetical protein
MQKNSNSSLCPNCHEVDCLNEGFSCSIYRWLVTGLECHEAVDCIERRFYV